MHADALGRIKLLSAKLVLTDEESQSLRYCKSYSAELMAPSSLPIPGHQHRGVCTPRTSGCMITRTCSSLSEAHECTKKERGRNKKKAGDDTGHRCTSDSNLFVQFFDVFLRMFIVWFSSATGCSPLACIEQLPSWAELLPSKSNTGDSIHDGRFRVLS